MRATPESLRPADLPQPPRDDRPIRAGSRRILGICGAGGPRSGYQCQPAISYGLQRGRNVRHRDSGSRWRNWVSRRITIYARRPSPVCLHGAGGRAARIDGPMREAFAKDRDRRNPLTQTIGVYGCWVGRGKVRRGGMAEIAYVWRGIYVTLAISKQE